MPADLANAGKRLGTEPAIEEGMRTGRVRHVLVDGDFGQVGAEDVGARLQDDRDQRDHHLPGVGLQIAQQTAHQPRVVRFA